MQTLVIYQSSYGFSERYAKWIAEELGCRVVPTKEIDVEGMKKYEAIIYCGGLYAGRISGFSLIKENYGALKDKQIILVGIGVSYPSEKIYQSVRKQNLASAMETVEFFYLPGGLDYEKMNWLHRLLMSARHWMIGRKNQIEWDENDRGFMETYGQNVDFSSREKILPIIRCIGE